MPHLAKLLLHNMGGMQTTVRDAAAIGSGPWRTSLRVLHIGNLTDVTPQALGQVRAGLPQVSLCRCVFEVDSGTMQGHNTRCNLYDLPAGYVINLQKRNKVQQPTQTGFPSDAMFPAAGAVPAVQPAAAGPQVR